MIFIGMMIKILLIPKVLPWFLLKIVILAVLALLLLLSGCIYWSTYARVDHSDPIIQLAEKQCGTGKADSGGNDCYVRIALENKKPEVCLLANPAIDDWCIQDYYEKRDSIEACEEIKAAKPGSITGCLEYYAQEKESCIACSSLGCFQDCLRRYDLETIECEKFSAEACPQSCVVCPPCEVCSSIACGSSAFCESMGFDKSWYGEIKKRLGAE